MTFTFTISRTGDGILTCMMWLAVGIDAWRNDADRLAFKHRERHRPKVEHDVVGVVILLAFLFADFGDTQIARDGGSDGFVGSFGAIQVGISVGSRPRWERRAVSRRIKTRYNRTRS